MDLKLNVRKILFIGIIAGYFLFTGYIAYNQSVSDRFNDEVAHMVGGHFVLKGKELYKDLQFNHQPLAYYFGAAAERISSPDNLYFYISRQRLAIYAYGLFWNILFFLFFGPYILIFSFIFEIGKYWFSGQKLLAETLAAYPLIFMFASLIESMFMKKHLSKIKLGLISVSTFIAGFSLLPLWIVVMPINVIIWWFQKNRKQSFLLLSIPFLFLTGILFMFISPYNLLRETYTYNVQYFVPETAEFRPALWQMLLFPFFTLIPPYSLTKIVSAAFVVSFFVSGYASWRTKKLIPWFLLLILFIGTNFFRVGDSAFSSFHLLPWFGTLLIMEILLTYYFYNSKNKIVKQISKIKVILFSALFVAMILDQKHLWQKKNLTTEFEVQYSYSETYGRAIKALKDSNDTLIVAQNDPLVYWVADINTPTRMLEFYPWIYPIPEYNAEIEEIFTNNPPEFFVNTNLDLKQDLEKYIHNNLGQKYIRIDHLGKPSRLYILKKKIPEITDSQWKQLEDMLFSKP